MPIDLKEALKEAGLRLYNLSAHGLNKFEITVIPVRFNSNYPGIMLNSIRDANSALNKLGFSIKSVKNDHEIASIAFVIERCSESSNAAPEQHSESAIYLKKSLEDKIVELERARERIDILLERVAELECSTANDFEKFNSVKREFAKRFHPDKCGCSGLEKTVRSEVFIEFWRVIDNIAKSCET